MMTFLRFSAGLQPATIHSWVCRALLLLLMVPRLGQSAPFLRGVPPQQVVAGSAHSLFLRADGNLWAWGSNDSGQLGDGTTTNRRKPVRVSLPTDKRFVQVAAGSSHSLALSTDGVVYAWGRNSAGQLGDGTTTDRSTPAAISLPVSKLFVQVAAGAGSSLALAADGTLYAWGANDRGQLGDGSTTGHLVPVAVALPTGKLFRHVAAGASHALALAADGTIYAWGANDKGQLGNGSTTDSSLPTAVAPGAAGSIRFGQLAAGSAHSLALAADGNVYAWGANTGGQLGDNSTTTRLSPAPVTMPVGKLAVQVVAGQSHSLLLAADGLAYAWGSNADGQLGTSDSGLVTSPVAVSLARRVVQLAAGHAHALALVSDGSFVAWGANGSGQLGDGSTTGRTTPGTVGLGDTYGYTQVAAGTYFSLGLLANGTVRAWGHNGYGQLGNATTNYLVNSTAVNVKMPADKRFVQVAGGEDFAVALADDGTAYAWGQNNLYQLGNGTTTLSNLPVAVTMPTGKRFVSVVAGQYHALALTADGLLYGWGLNGYGQLSSTSQFKPTPSLVPMPATVRLVQVVNGENHLLALAADGTAYALGSNSKGQLGVVTSGTTANAAVAVTMPTGKLFISLGAGANHSLAVAADGSAYGWGANGNGQLATGTNADPYSNTNVALLPVPLPRVVQLAGGLAHSLALTADGRLFAWGYNGNGQLGYITPSKANGTTPARERTSGTRWSGIASGPRANHSLAIGPNDGTSAAGIPSGAVFTAGLNNYGQLGDDSRTESDIFVRNRAPLPVEMVSFRVQSQGVASLLSWTTASERNSAYFQIERSYSGQAFEPLSRVAAQGSSARPYHYTYTDEHPAAPLVYYRLRQVDADGSFSYSPVQVVAFPNIPALDLVLYPNPAHGSFVVEAGLANTLVQVFDLLGQPVARAVTGATGQARVTLPLGLRAGCYVVRCGTASSHLFVK